MAQYVFATGDMFTVPVGGGNPFKFGALQDVSVDFSADVKQLFGQYQFPLDVARGKTKIEGKAATGQVNAAAFNTFYFNQTVTTGQLQRAINEAHSVPAMSTYTVTVTHGADFDLDLGVYYAATGVPLAQVASMPAQGEYTVSSVGVYTFNSADASEDLLFNYLWNDDAAGFTLDIGNPLMGDTPKFKLVLSQTYKSQTFTLVLNSCTAEKLSLPLKQDDYLIADLTFQAQADDANRIGAITTTG